MLTTVFTSVILGGFECLKVITVVWGLSESCQGGFKGNKIKYMYFVGGAMELLKKVKWQKVQTWKKADCQITKGKNKRDQSSMKSDQVSAGGRSSVTLGGGYQPEGLDTLLHTFIQTLKLTAAPVRLKFREPFLGWFQPFIRHLRPKGWEFCFVI